MAARAWWPRLWRPGLRRPKLRRPTAIRATAARGRASQGYGSQGYGQWHGLGRLSRSRTTRARGMQGGDTPVVIWRQQRLRQLRLRQHWAGRQQLGLVRLDPVKARASRREARRARQRTDDRLKDDICERLYNTQHIDSSEVTVDVKEGKITLDGSVPQRGMKHALEDLIDTLPGVHDIDNRVRVSRQQSGPSGQSQSGQSQWGSQSVSHSGQSQSGQIAVRAKPVDRHRLFQQLGERFHGRLDQRHGFDRVGHRARGVPVPRIPDRARRSPAARNRGRNDASVTHVNG